MSGNKRKNDLENGNSNSKRSHNSIAGLPLKPTFGTELRNPTFPANNHNLNNNSNYDNNNNKDSGISNFVSQTQNYTNQPNPETLKLIGTLINTIQNNQNQQSQAQNQGQVQGQVQGDNIYSQVPSLYTQQFPSHENYVPPRLGDHPPYLGNATRDHFGYNNNYNSNYNNIYNNNNTNSYNNINNYNNNYNNNHYNNQYNNNYNNNYNSNHQYVPTIMPNYTPSPQVLNQQTKLLDMYNNFVQIQGTPSYNQQSTPKFNQLPLSQQLDEDTKVNIPPKPNIVQNKKQSKKPKPQSSNKKAKGNIKNGSDGEDNFDDISEDDILDEEKTFAIQGTNIVFENEEDVAKWIEERKKNWPTNKKVEEKKKEMETAKKIADNLINSGTKSSKSKTKVCSFWLKTKKCRNGKNCKFSHDVSDLPNKEMNPSKKSNNTYFSTKSLPNHKAKIVHGIPIQIPQRFTPLSNKGKSLHNLMVEGDQFKKENLDVISIFEKLVNKGVINTDWNKLKKQLNLDVE